MSRKRERPDYATYIKSRRWWAMRRRYFASGLPTVCQGLTHDGPCEKAHVDLHHWTYKNLGDERVTDLIPLCRSCHERVHELAGGTTNAKALKQATKAVCGRDILHRQQEALARARRTARVVASQPKVARHLRPLPDIPQPSNPYVQPALENALSAFGAALRRGEDGKPFNRRVAHLRRVAREAGREDIAQALAKYEHKVDRRKDIAHGEPKPWDTHTIRLGPARLGKAKRKKIRKAA